LPLDVLTPVPRRPRNRYRSLRRTLLTAVGLIALGTGLFFGWRTFIGGPRHAAAASPGKPSAASTHRTARPVKPLRLLHGPAQFADRLRILAPSAILVDAHTGDVVWAKEAHERRPVASLTKIMTATLALRELPWHRVVTVAPAVPHVPLVREGLRAGEHVPAWKLFYAMLLYSGNDDALQLAISSAGSDRAFLQKMNEEARELGLHGTHFTSPSGVIDQGNYSTAWDLAALTRYARRNPVFRRIVRTKRIEVSWAPPTNSKIYVNNNALLSEYWGANGVKTGYTHASGWCLVASATRGGRTLIAVVLDSENIYADAKTLLNFGFSHAVVKFSSG
jgi:serine-type D-Ala-D-Ala carboxypeptidase (penicillin-binding protein 5/6)